MKSKRIRDFFARKINYCEFEGKMTFRQRSILQFNIFQSLLKK